MKTKFNRKDVSSWCKWIAVDKDGACWEYSEAPKTNAFFALWDMTEPSKTKFLYKGAQPKNWKEELYTWG